MSEIKWIKLSVNMFDDEKIKLIRTMPEGDAIVIIWVQILCLAGKINDNGMVYMGQNLAYSDEMLATILDHPVNIMRIALKTLEQFGMIEVNNDGTIDVLNWEKHQSTDKMARIRHQNRERKRRYDLRNKLRELGYDPDAKEVPYEVDELRDYIAEIESNVTVTSGNATEVRSKMLDVRGKKEEVNTTTEKKEKEPEKSSSGGELLSKNVFGAWEELWMFPNAIQKEVLIELSNQYKDELVVAAIKVAGVNDVAKGRAVNFVEAVLKEWADNNVNTMEEAREYTKNRNKGKGNRNYNKRPIKKETLPDWANESTPKADEAVDDDFSSRLAELRKGRQEE